MASLITTLILGGDKKNKRNIQNLSFEFTQTTDKDGLPSGVPRGGNIKMTLRASKDKDLELFAWMCDKALKKNGIIKIMDPSDSTKVMKKIEFKDAFCVGYSETLSDKDSEDPSENHTETITVKTIRKQLLFPFRL